MGLCKFGHHEGEGDWHDHYKEPLRPVKQSADALRSLMVKERANAEPKLPAQQSQQNQGQQQKR